jgi:hypothetical protein
MADGRWQMGGERFGVPVRDFGMPVRGFEVPVREFEVPVRGFKVPVCEIGDPVCEIGVPVWDFGMPVREFEVPVCEIGDPVCEIGVPVWGIGDPVRHFGMPVCGNGHRGTPNDRRGSAIDYECWLFVFERSRGIRTVAVALRSVYRAPKIWGSAILSRKIFLRGRCREFNDWWRVIKGSSQSDTAVLAASPPTRTSPRPHGRGIWGRWQFCQGNCPILVALIISVVSNESMKGVTSQK